MYRGLPRADMSSIFKFVELYNRWKEPTGPPRSLRIPPYFYAIILILNKFNFTERVTAHYNQDHMGPQGCPL